MTEAARRNKCYWCGKQMNRRHLDPLSATLDHYTRSLRNNLMPMVRCRCVACGNITLQPADPQDPRYIKSWFCGCQPKPEGTALAPPPSPTPGRE